MPPAPTCTICPRVGSLGFCAGVGVDAAETGAGESEVGRGHRSNWDCGRRRGRWWRRLGWRRTWRAPRPSCACASCWSGLEPISDPKCVKYGRLLQHDPPQGKCGQWWLMSPVIERTRAWCLYNDTSQAIILKFKHGNGLALTPVLAAMLGRLYDELGAPGSLVIPVPLHWWQYLH